VAAGCLGLLLLLSLLAILIARYRRRSVVIYGACALVTCALALLALQALLSPAPPQAIELAVGLPLGRTILGYDRLGAAFALIINLATTLVSGYAIGYGAHAREPQRIVPFYPAFIAGMNLVLLSSDAFSFLVGWEFMSLASWALVVSDHTFAENRRAALGGCCGC
jgi:hydrogenase-4 component B